MIAESITKSQSLCYLNLADCGVKNEHVLSAISRKNNVLKVNVLDHYEIEDFCARKRVPCQTECCHFDGSSKSNATRAKGDIGDDRKVFIQTNMEDLLFFSTSVFSLFSGKREQALKMYLVKGGPVLVLWIKIQRIFGNMGQRPAGQEQCLPWQKKI